MDVMCVCVWGGGVQLHRSH